MANGKPWVRGELLVAMNLYCKLPFGQLRHGNPLVIAVAEKLGRTPSSLSMKLCNLASLDPYHQARGVKGLRGASNADRAIWSEFNADWGRMGVASEELFQRLFGGEQVEAEPSSSKENMPQPQTIKPPRSFPTGPTEILQTTKARLGQRFFRQSVLAAYNTRCCITENPVPELLVASHILPWGKCPEQRLNPCNGLCLAQTQDAAFDRGLITFDEEFRLVVGPYLKAFLPSEALERDFLVYEGMPLKMPDKFLPSGVYMQTHREDCFVQWQERG